MRLANRCTRPFVAGLAAALGLIIAAAPASAADPSCSQLFKIRSQNSDTATKITFVNDSGTVRALLWLDFSGQPKDYGSLNPGQQLTFDTFVTHPWMIATGPGDCLEIVMPRPGGSVIRIADESSGEEGGEEGEGGQHSCPPGTEPVPETDDCRPIQTGGGEEGDDGQHGCPPGSEPVPETDDCRPIKSGGGAFPTSGRSLGGVMRSKPSMGSSKVLSLAENTPIDILKDAGVEMNGYRWFKIRAKGRTGYQWGGIMCSDEPLDGMFETCR